MRKELERILSKHGTDLTILRGEKRWTVRAFFRAVNSKSWHSVESQESFLGEISRELFSFLGPADAGVQEGDSVLVGEKSYLFCRVESYRFGNEVVYLWGLCVEKGGNDVWDTNS